MFAQQIAALKLLILNNDKKHLGVLEHLTEMADFDQHTYAGVLQEIARIGIPQNGTAFYEKAVSVLPAETQFTYHAIAQLYQDKVDAKLLKSIAQNDLVFLGDDIRLDVYNKCLFHSFFVMEMDIIDALVTKLNESAGENTCN